MRVCRTCAALVCRPARREGRRATRQGTYVRLDRSCQQCTMFDSVQAKPACMAEEASWTVVDVKRGECSRHVLANVSLVWARIQHPILCRFWRLRCASIRQACVHLFPPPGRCACFYFFFPPVAAAAEEIPRHIDCPSCRIVILSAAMCSMSFAYVQCSLYIITFYMIFATRLQPKRVHARQHDLPDSRLSAKPHAGCCDTGP